MKKNSNPMTGDELEQRLMALDAIVRLVDSRTFAAAVRVLAVELNTRGVPQEPSETTAASTSAGS